MSSSRTELITVLVSAAITLGFGVSVHAFVVTRPTFHPLIQVSAICGLALGILALILAALRGTRILCLRAEREDLPFLASAALLHSVAWGPMQYVGIFHHDEWGYFATIGQSWASKWEWLLVPLNEHFQPVFKLLVELVYGSLGINYFAVATASISLFLLVIAGAYFLVRTLTQSRALGGIAAGIVAAWPGLAEVTQWKAAGMPLFMSMGPFLLSIPVALEWNQSRRPGAYLVYLALVTGTVFSSSLFSIPAIYLLALAPSIATAREDRRSSWEGFAWLLLGSLAVTSGYFAIRIALGIPMPGTGRVEPLQLLSMIGSFLKTGVLRLRGGSDLGWGIVAVILVTLSLAQLARALKTAPREQLAERAGHLSLFLVGSGLLIVPTLQICAVRGLHVEGIPGSRYFFAQAIGCAIALSAVAAGWFWSSRVDALLSRPRYYLSLASCWAILLIWLPNEPLFPRDMIIRIIEVRREFFLTLDQAVCKVDRSLARPPGRPPRPVILPDLSMDLLKEELGIGYPFNSARYGYSLGYYARLSQNRCLDGELIRFVPGAASESEGMALPEVRAFYSRYFGT
jgi:hypothetical protein